MTADFKKEPLEMFTSEHLSQFLKTSGQDNEAALRGLLSAGVAPKREQVNILSNGTYQVLEAQAAELQQERNANVSKVADTNKADARVSRGGMFAQHTVSKEEPHPTNDKNNSSKPEM